ncbi:MAG TPA: dienelactone hydrolase family protein [Candidatus Dormibacteraeota bacterium]
MITRAVTFPTPAARLNGYLALPDGAGPHPGVVVIHEAYGLNDNIRDITGRFAGEGYAALPVDLFTNRSRVVCMARLMGAMVAGREPAAVTELTAALDYLIALPEVDSARTGAVGFCMGGGVAIAWATRDRRLRAIAPFYGTNPRPVVAVRRLCPVVGSYPGHDFTARSGRKLDAELTAAGVTHDIKVYPGARHSFFNDQGRAYDATASADAWERTLAFFAEHVRTSPVPP